MREKRRNPQGRVVPRSHRKQREGGREGKQNKTKRLNPYETHTEPSRRVPARACEALGGCRRSAFSASAVQKETTRKQHRHKKLLPVKGSCCFTSPPPLPPAVLRNGSAGGGGVGGTVRPCPGSGTEVSRLCPHLMALVLVDGESGVFPPRRPFPQLSK